MDHQNGAAAPSLEAFELVEQADTSLDMALKHMSSNLRSLETAMGDNTNVLVEAMRSSEATVVQTMKSSDEKFSAKIDDNVATALQALQKSGEKLETEMKMLSQNVTSVRTENHHVKMAIKSLHQDIGTMKRILEEERKEKRIERAMSLTHIESFSYFAGKNDPNMIGRSGTLAKKILGLFLLGRGGCLPQNATLLKVDHVSDGDRKADEKAFREKFKEQIKNLIQREPRLFEQADGKFAIYYQ